MCDKNQNLVCIVCILNKKKYNILTQPTLPICNTHIDCFCHICFNSVKVTALFVSYYVNFICCQLYLLSLAVFALRSGDIHKQASEKCVWGGGGTL